MLRRLHIWFVGGLCLLGAGCEHDPGPLAPPDDAGPANDGTTGVRCSSSADCRRDGGPAINLCSNEPEYSETVAGVNVELWSTPVCLEALSDGSGLGCNCDPAPADSDPAGLQIHFCDGPDSPSSPGICVAAAPDNAQTGQGYCYPKCSFDLDGGSATGCAGHDACVFYNDRLSPSDGGVTGFGFCIGSCARDADCEDLGAGFRCQTDLGLCTESPVARNKLPGAACSIDDEAGACNCYYDGARSDGYCSTQCVVGETPCPDGWICDSGESTPVVFAGASAVFPLTAPTKGLIGTCSPACSLLPASAEDSGSSTDGCPATSVCVGSALIGPHCLP